MVCQNNLHGTFSHNLRKFFIRHACVMLDFSLLPHTCFVMAKWQVFQGLQKPLYVKKWTIFKNEDRQLKL